MKTRMKIGKLTMEKGKKNRSKDLYNHTLYVRQKISQKLNPVRVCLGVGLVSFDYLGLDLTINIPYTTIVISFIE